MPNQVCLDPPLTAEQRARVSQLNEAEVVAIDQALVANLSKRWQKVAMVVGTTMQNQPDRVSGIPDLFYAERVWKLVGAGSLEYSGELNSMRNCEVRVVD